VGKTIIVGSTEFKVDLQQFEQAIGTVSSSTNAINEDFVQIQTILQAVEMAWKGPAGETYQEVQATLTSATGEMISTLGQVISRMKTTYQNYLDMETANANNVS
jgi:WXG100 family type VII secretion target